jgi:predicted HicB family RNase H-like nuclease
MAKSAPFSMRMDEDLKEELQVYADEENRSLTNFIETELRRAVAQRKAEAAKQSDPKVRRLY